MIVIGKIKELSHETDIMGFIYDLRITIFDKEKPLLFKAYELPQEQIRCLIASYIGNKDVFIKTDEKSNYIVYAESLG